jgi:peptidoglycan/xylan/chitin deacetylase (PgdA/CDA1 family)
MLKNAIKLFIISALFICGVAWAKPVPILMYHHLREPQGFSGAKKDLSCPPKVFIDHLNYLKSKGYNVVTFKDVADGNEGLKPIILTFDDGTYTHWWAYQELKKRNLKGVFFVSVNAIDTRNYLKKWQLDLMVNDGMEIGSHSFSHPDLRTLSFGQLTHEIYESKIKLESMFQTKVIAFAYPFGNYSKEIIDIIESSGYSYARTTDEGITDFGKDKNFRLTVIYIHCNTRNLEKLLK